MHSPTMLLAAVVLLFSSGCAGSSQTFRHGELTIHTLENGYNNAHLVVQRGSAVLVDAGLPEDAPSLVEQIRGVGVDPAKLEAVIVTHGHTDHAGGAKFFHDQYGVPIVAGAGDRDMMAAGKNDPLCPTDGTARCLLHDSQTPTYRPTVADVWIDKPTRLGSFSKLAGQVIPLPGHTPGSLVVTVGDVALVGDLFRGAILGSSAEVHFYMCDLEDNRRDIATLLGELAPKATTFFVGHFGPVARADVDALLSSTAW